jgi:acyl-CoA synthetase (AMP-forming)/AMP-acid ligase II
MGLIGNLLFCIYWGMPLVVLPPRTFALNPESWLWALSRFSGTCSAAPNSAYHACATRIGDSRMEGLDLRSWRVAFNGSELIQRSTVEQFANRFAGFGYRPTTMYPVYGLAEHTLAASLPKHGVRPHFDEIGSERLASDGVAEPAAHGERERAVACVGAPLPGQALRIVDPLTMQVVPERVVGEIQLRGGCTMRGYCGAAPGTGLTPDGWLRSGDRGYLVSGNLHVVGRYKHIVKRGGRTLDCAYIEHVLSALPDVRGGGVAAFGSTDANNGCEELVVLVETRAAGAQRDALRNAICAAMIGTGLPAPDLIQFVRPGQIPRTTSGKIRHAAARGAVSSVDH